MERLEGFIDHIIFRNSENGYTVLVLSTKDGDVTCVGNLPEIGQGENVEFTGQYKIHPVYGEQFQIDSYRIKAPEDAASIERYLGSGAIKGVGRALAGRIVKAFGDDTFRIIDEEPERLAEVKGISQRMAREISAQIFEKRGMRSAMLYLQQFGISTSLASKIYKRYGTHLEEVISENPYRLADDISGVGFRIADDIAMRAGVQKDSEYRLKSGIFYVLQQAALEGHLYLPKDLLMERTAELLSVEIESIDDYLSDLSIEKKIVIRKEKEKTCIYTREAWLTELDTARMICDRNVYGSADESEVRKEIEKIEKKTKTLLDEGQKQAVIRAVRSGLLVITGGPGTGKTTTINALIAYFESQGLKILLAAPTGRAAKRITEATGCEAKTIHRLLEISGDPEGSSGQFSRNEENPLDADVIIIDEMSMVDIYLMHALLKAVSVGTRLIMVGDADQLPSVGPGSVLKDIIDSDQVPVVRLTHIFRQATQSDIVLNAHRINRGEHFPLDNDSKDFFFLKRRDADEIIRVIISLVSEKLPRYVNAEPFDIQVLTPMRKGLLGVERLNSILQATLNPPDQGKREIKSGERLFREGDKVMQIKNNYQITWEIRGRYGISVESGTGIFNGDMGVIREINPFEETVTIEFDEHRQASYPLNGLEEIELSYAVTIHKSQGSEYPAVVIPLFSGPKMLMNRNLLYTAVTRAKKCVVLTGNPVVFDRMIDNANQQERYTALDLRIRELIDAGDF